MLWHTTEPPPIGKVMSERIVKVMLLILFPLNRIHGLHSTSCCCAALISPSPRTLSRCGIRRHLRSATGTGMAIDSVGTSPNDNNHRSVGRNTSAHLQLLLQKNDVSLNELNEHCLIALSRCPDIVANYAVEAYSRQKRKREMKKENKISDPSSYVMAVLR